MFPKYEGDYIGISKRPLKVYREETTLYYKIGDNDPLKLKAVTETLYRLGEKPTTIEFILNKEGIYETAELRGGTMARNHSTK